MSEINITIEDSKNQNPDQVVKIIKFAGQLDETNVDEKSKIIYDLINSVPKGLMLIFDFTDLEYMNSKSVGYLTDWYTKISEKGGSITVAAAKPNIVDILEVVGLTQIIKFVGSIAEAVSGAQAPETLQPPPQPQPTPEPSAPQPAAQVPPAPQVPVQPAPASQPQAAPTPEPTPAQEPAPAPEPTPTPQATPAQKQGNVVITHDQP